jgi:hypothetical protein
MLVNEIKIKAYKDELDPKNETTVEQLINEIDDSYEALERLDKLLNNHGVETITLGNGQDFSYSNTGFIYSTTFVLYNGRLRISTYSSYVERYEIKDSCHGY